MGFHIKIAEMVQRRTWALFLAVGLFLLPATAWCQEGEEDELPSPVRISHDDAGNAQLTVDPDTQSRIALATTLLSREVHQPEVTAYGVLIEDPGQSFTLRSPVAGYLRSIDEVTWPSVGDHVAAGTVIATVEPRLTPTESLDLLTRWMDTRAEVDELSAEVEAARSSYENKKHLNEDGKLVSDRSVEEADARLKTSEARLEAVTKRVEVIENIMPSQGTSQQQLPLVVLRGGEVVEVTAQPDETVESAQPLLRAARFDQLIARVSILVGLSVPDPLPQARLTVVGHEEQVLAADPVGRAPSTDETTRGDTLLFRIIAPQDGPLRPGTPVVVHIPTNGTGLAGTVVPRSAVLRYGGIAWVYVLTSPTQFSRRTVVLKSPLESGWFVTDGVSPGESVVTNGAQSLLSEELKAQIESEEEAAE